MTEDLVVIGLGCRLPEADSAAAFWKLVERRATGVGALGPDRFDANAFAFDLPQGFAVAPRAGLLGDIVVDWKTLRLPPVDAENLHRTERAALASISDAIIDAGTTADAALRKRTRIFIGANRLGTDLRTDPARRIRSYEMQAPVSRALAERLPYRMVEIDDILSRLFTLAAPPINPDSLAATASLIAGRVANLFDLKGGHLAVDAGHASSLAALGEAAASLRAGDCDVAVVCGVAPLVSASTLISFAHRQWLAPDGVARPFADDATGSLLGEGCVGIVLMRSSDAKTRRVYARLMAIASAYAGADPTPAAVERAVSRAASRCLASVARPIGLIESRAAGIRQVDRAEALGIVSACGPNVRMSSSVVNVGFLQAASGMVATLKAILTLHHGRFVPHTAAAFNADGVRLGGDSTPIGADEVVGVSDAGMAPEAWHAIFGAALAPAARIALAARSSMTNPSLAAPRFRREEAIAIVGIGVTAPDAPNTATFWSNVLLGVDSVGDLPPSRFDVDKMIGSSAEMREILRTRLAAAVEIPRATLVEHGLPTSLLDSVDPSVLLALEVTRQAFADAGPKLDENMLRRTRVIFGQLPYRVREVDVERRVLFSLYLALTAEAMKEADVDDERAKLILDDARRAFERAVPRIDASAVLHESGVACAAHVADAFGAEAGAVCIDAACASSLTAVEIGARALRRGDVDAVIAGGVAFNLLPEYYVALSMLGVLSQRGEPPFSADAAGFVPGEGAGAVLLMRLPDAIARGHRVHALLRGVGASSDGRGVSVFAPTKAGQVLAMRRALEAEGINPSTVDLVEAHGTGTKLGDETELSSTRTVYAARDPLSPVTVGSIKAQMGHLSSAAGIVGLAKVALALSERVLPPSLFDSEHRAMITDGIPGIELAARPRGWPIPVGHPRRAAVSSFGLGGVNLHAVLEEVRSASAESEFLGAPRAPGEGVIADRFEVALTPLSLPERPPLFPLRGRAVLLVSEGGNLSASFEQALARRGARVAVLPPSVAAADVDAHVQALRQGAGGTLHAVIDLSGAVSTPSAFGDPAAWLAHAEQGVVRAMAVLKAVYDDFAAAEELERGYATITMMGGDLGLSGTGPAFVAGAGWLGLAKAVKQELPRVVARGIDFDPQAKPDSVAELALSELEDGNDRMEVGYSPGRAVMNLVRCPVAHGADVPRRIPRHAPFLFSGGGRGIVFECALAMAKLGVPVIVTGRTARPAEGQPWLSLDDEAFAQFRKDELVRRRQEEPTLTPVQFGRDFDALVRQRELHTNLTRAERLGVPLTYAVCDVTDAAQVRQAVEDVRRAHGAIGGIVHGAMVEWSTSIPKKTAAVVTQTLRTKLQGFLNLFAAVAEAPPHTFLCFGSGAGRFGSRGQADYCAANALLAALATSASAQTNGRTRFATIDWTAWRETGAAVRDPDIAALVSATGITSISSAEGVYWFLTELLRGQAHEIVVFEEKMLGSLLALGDRSEGSGQRSIIIDDVGVPLVPGHWPMVDAIIESNAEILSFERLLHAQRDAFLAQHMLDGVPILPATFGCETLAEAAALLSPGFQIVQALDLEIDAPMKLFRNAPQALTVTARLIDAVSAQRVVTCESRSDFQRGGQVLQRDRLHHRGRFLLQPAGERKGRTVAVPDLGAFVRARSFFHMSKDPVALGPLFCRAEWLQISGEHVTGEVRPERQRSILFRSSAPRFQVDPLLMDAAFQIAANWDGVVNGYVSIPTGVGSLTLGRKRTPNEHARVWARVVRVEDPVVYYDIDVTGERNEVLMEIRRLTLHRVARLPGPSVIGKRA